jgi:hypothetical protein
MMDRDEEEGLRAFALEVGAYAGSASPERPAWVLHEGRRRDVTVIDAQWREVERLGFRVRLEGGPHALLYYVPELDLWSGIVLEDGKLEPARRRVPGGSDG